MRSFSCGHLGFRASKTSASTPGVLVFTTILAVTTGILFGLAPAIELTRPDLATPLKDGGWSGAGSRRGQRFRGFLAVLQMAFSVVLLVGALLLVRTSSNYGESTSASTRSRH